MMIIEEMGREERVNRILEEARRQIGKFYSWGQDIDFTIPIEPKAFDCSSLVQWCFLKGGIVLKDERSTILQAAASGREITKLEDLQPGDLIFFDGGRGYYRRDLFNGRKIDIGHVAICGGDGKIIHAAGAAGMVVEQELAEVSKQLYRKITFMKRYF